MSKENDKIKRNWSKIDSNYSRVNLRFNKEEVLKLSPLFLKSEEKYYGTFIKKNIFYGGTDYKEIEKKQLELEVLYKKYIENLRRIGNNINQVAMKLNHINFIDDGEKELLFESLDELKKEIFDYRKRSQLK